MFGFKEIIEYLEILPLIYLLAYSILRMTYIGGQV